MMLSEKNICNRCGYVGGILFANQLGLTTQVPALYEVYTNKATTEYRETKLANLRVILRKPYCEIDTENAATLQFLDLIKEVVDISEVDGEDPNSLNSRRLLIVRTEDNGGNHDEKEEYQI